jgi:hypothetical protein
MIYNDDAMLNNKGEIMKIEFKDFQKEIKGIKYRSKKDWEMFLPFNTSKEDIQTIIDQCRKDNITNWHIIYSEVNDKIPEPEIKIYWD